MGLERTGPGYFFGCGLKAAGVDPAPIKVSVIGYYTAYF